MGSSNCRLSRLQQEFLDAWFEQTSAFYLTGGAALVARFQIPRITKDLDLFTGESGEFLMAGHLLIETCTKIGAQSESLRTAPTFRRYRISRNDESTLVDLVDEPVAPVHPEKITLGAWLLDPPEEILVNKICAIVGRGEPRDFVDTCFLAQQGLDVERALLEANQKDAGVDRGTLLYVLSDMNWQRFNALDVDPELVSQTAQFFQNWCEKLALRLYPQ